MFSWSANWIPLLLFRPQFILVSHFEDGSGKVPQTYWIWDRLHANAVDVICKTESTSSLVAILKDWFVVDSNNIYLASVSCTSPKTYNYSCTSLWCEQHLPNWNYFRFLSTIFISGVTWTLGDVNIIAIKT